MLSIQASWLETIGYWVKKMFRPRGLNQLLGNLLLASWTILAFDQLFHVIFILCVSFACPTYNCRNYTSFATPGCPAGLFEGLQLIIQPFGSCCFIVATVNRFVNVYSQLSRRRYIALRVGTSIVCLVCTGMSIVTAMAYTVLSSPLSTLEQASQAHELLLLGDFVTYSSIGIVSILALIMGLEYIVKIRKEVNSLRPSIATPSIFQPKEHQQPAPGAAAHWQIKSSALLYSPSTSPSFEPLPPNVSLQPIQQPTTAVPRSGRHWRIWDRIRSKEGRQSLTTVMCIFINILIIVLFLTEHPYLKATAQPTSALFDSAFMSMCHKVFSATVTVAIHQMTDLVLAKNRQN
ncbi:hypothetical protein BCR44DRAFT_69366 [Catenaria anguillulae PL171]|uniref:Uncharacterized protein n=1 Tax=Catenaria anguillulae PL171 TaxID=765915 RepID=A0A1Y2H473_9FUNG|nr:hypothetical protein BCR44DRAFT_69366 [Catenaria anguillulae PL171]